MNEGSTTVLARVESLTERYAQTSNPGLAVDLFRALGWEREGHNLDPYGNLSSFRQYRLLVAGEPAGLLVNGPPSHEALRKASVNVAYNSGVDWAVLSDFASTEVLNSRWPDEPRVFLIPSSSYRAEFGRLRLLSPESVIDRALKNEADAKAPDRTLDPVDKQLTAAFETWRRLLLANSTTASDEQVHELIGRLLFVRSCEDRQIIEPGTLRRVQDRGSGINIAMRALFRVLEAQFEGELFASDGREAPNFEPSVLARVIEELYVPYPSLPAYRYDFSYLDVDVLGKVYERYVSTILERRPRTSEQQVLFEDSVGANIETTSRRREQGIYYTPPFMVNYIVQHTVDAHIDEAGTLPAVADISCGSGAFLVRAADRVSKRLHDTPDRGSARKQALSFVRGVDVDPRAVTLARVNLWILATMGQPPKPLPELGSRLAIADALFDRNLDELRGRMDVVIGNPPFRSIAEMESHRQGDLRARYSTARDRFDIAYVFVERAMQLLKPGGRLGLVLPNRLFTNSGASAVRRLFADEAIVEKVVDFVDQSAFAQGTSYVSIVIARKRSVGGEEPDQIAAIQIHRIKKLGDYPGLQLRRADLVGHEHFEDASSEIFQVPQEVGPGPWVWSSTQVDERIALKLASDGTSVSDIAAVHQGVKTGSNDIFLVNRVGEGKRPGSWLVQSRAAGVFEIEPDLLRPSARGGSVTRYSLDTAASEYVLYPHRSGRLLQPFELQASFPLTFAYLMRFRDRLAARSTTSKGRPWYDVAWSRGEEWVDQPKLLARELMPAAQFALDTSGTFIPVGGTAIIPSHAIPPALLLLGLFNSALMDWYLARTSAVFQGGFMKVVPGQVGSFMFPWRLFLDTPQLISRIGALADGAMRARGVGAPTDLEDREIDATLFSILGLDTDERAAIRDASDRRRRARNDGERRGPELGPSLGPDIPAGDDDGVRRLLDLRRTLLHQLDVAADSETRRALALTIAASDGIIRAGTAGQGAQLIASVLASIRDNQRLDLAEIERSLARLGPVMPTIRRAGDMLVDGSYGDSTDDNLG